MNGGGFKHESDDVQEVKASMMGRGGGGAPVMDKVDRACQLREEIMIKIERLGKHLPANTLDQLIDELGGPTNVSEMTGRKGRVVMDEVSGDVRYESRSDFINEINTAKRTCRHWSSFKPIVMVFFYFPDALVTTYPLKL